MSAVTSTSWSVFEECLLQPADEAAEAASSLSDAECVIVEEDGMLERDCVWNTLGFTALLKKN